MGYRKVSRIQAKQLAKAAGLTKKHIYQCGFREGMAEHAAKLMISIAVKGRISRDAARTAAIEVA